MRLELFARSYNPRFRAVAAGHPKTPERTLLLLAHDEDLMVRRSLALNPGLPESVRRVLEDDEDAGISLYARLRRIDD